VDSRAVGKRDGEPRGFFEGELEQLIAKAIFEFSLGRTSTIGGASEEAQIAHLIEKGVLPEEDYISPDVPQGLEYLWEGFKELTATRQSGMAGMEALQYFEIDAFLRLTDRIWSPHDVRAIVKMDMEVRVAIQEKAKKGKK